MPLRFVIFFVVITTLLTVVALYLSRRIATSLGLGTRGRRIALGVLLAATWLPFIARFVGGDALRWVGVSGFVVTLGMLITTGLLLPFDALRALVARASRALSRAPRPSLLAVPTALAPIGGDGAAAPVEASAPEDTSPTLGRRALLTRAAPLVAATAGGGTSLYGVLLGRHDYQLEDVPIPLARLPRALDGYTIVQISDVHVGAFISDYELGAALDLARRARPDLIVLTGDLVDHDPRYAEQLGRWARSLRELGARDGVIAIPGNHDYYAGIDEVLSALRGGGVDVLRNDARMIGDAGGRFALLGVDDVWAGRSGESAGADLDRALSQLPAEARDPDSGLARVLLCHNPEYYPEAADRVDLQLSGHTHGGQVNFVIRPADLVLRHGYIAGRYARGTSQIYVNRGFGTAGPPARVGSPPEVSRIVLTSA